MQLRKLFLPGLLSITLLSGCSLFNSGEDVMKMSLLPTVENQFTPPTSWSTPVGDDVGKFYSNLHPAFTDDVVYAADRKDTAKVLSADDGREVWPMNLTEKDSWFSCVPVLFSDGATVSGNHVYTGNGKAQLYALDTSDGIAAWQTRVAGEALSCPVVNGGIALVHTNNDQLQALNETDDAVKWIVNLGMPALSLHGESTPATAYSAAIVGGDSGRVSAVLVQQGQMIWQQRISTTTGLTEIDRLNDVDTMSIIVNGTVCALVYNGDPAVPDLRSGQIMWRRELGSVSGFIVDSNCIYLVDQNDRLLVLTTDGDVALWMQGDLLYRLLITPVLYNDNLIVGDSEGYMYWVNPEDGYFVARRKVNSPDPLIDPVIADDRLLTQARGGVLYAITCQLSLS